MNSRKKIDELIQQNNVLRSQLTIENEKYYTDLLLYLRTAGLFYKQEDIEHQLIEILQDILDAQALGVGATAYFGEEPQVIADQLLANFPKAGVKEKMKIFAVIFGISSLFTFINQLNPNSNQLNMLPFLLNGLLTLISIQTIFWCMHNGIYSEQSDSKVKIKLIVASLFILIFSLFVGIQFLQPAALFFKVPNFILISFSFSFPLIFTGFTFWGKRKWRSLLLSMFPFVWVINSVYFLQKFNILDFQADSIAKYGLVIALVLSTFWSQYSLFLEEKKEL